MPFTPKLWENDAVGGTPLDAAAMIDLEVRVTDYAGTIVGTSGPWINIKDAPYSAVGNGVANDSTPIQSAITACASAGGGTVLIPVGQYKCVTGIDVPPGVRLLGLGALSYNESAPYVGSCLVAGTAGMTLLTDTGSGSLDQFGLEMESVNLIDPVGSSTTLLSITDTNHWNLKRIAFHGNADKTTVGLNVALSVGTDNSWNYMEDCHTRTAFWKFTSGFGVTIVGGSQIGNLVNCIDVGPTYSLFKMIGFKGENGNPSLRIQGFQCYVDGFQWEVSGTTVNAKAIQVDSDGTSISGKKIFLGGLALGGGGGAGHFGLEVTSDSTDVEIVGLTTANFTSGQGLSLIGGINTMMRRTNQGDITAPIAMDGGIKRFLTNTVPTTGAHIVGEIAWNSNPTSGGFMGWTCTGAGTPGTWKTFGPIS